MSLPEARAITAIWSSIPKEREEEIRKWHNLEHTTERLEGPGYIACRRYNREGGEGRHARLTVFEGVDLATFNSPYYLESRNNPTPWTRKSMGFIQDARRGVYELAVSLGERPRVEPPYVYTVRFDPAEGAEDEIAAWHKEEHFPRLCALESVLRARLFRRAEKISDTKTEETKMQGEQEGQQAFLAFFEMSSPGLIGGDAWKEAAAGTGRSAEMLKKLEGPFREIWWWDFVKYAPGII
ncbi:MAG: hypothetical protein V3U53_10020 [bacterium]